MGTVVHPKPFEPKITTYSDITSKQNEFCNLKDPSIFDDFHYCIVLVAARNVNSYSPSALLAHVYLPVCVLLPKLRGSCSIRRTVLILHHCT